MKSDTQILNEMSANSPYLHRLTEEESARMKRMLILMYQDFASLCEQSDLTFMLGGGSCLGAVRHKGFIPWDDDLDIMMPRKDYESLIELCRKGAMGDNYEYNTPSRHEDCKNPFLKIYRKGTLDNELYNENTPFPKGIFLDIFPMDNAPTGRLYRRLKGLISDGLMFISSCVLYAQYPSSKFKEFVSSDPTSLKRYRMRMIVGNIMKAVSHRRWVYWFDRFNASEASTGYITIPTGRKHYMGETQPSEVFLPVEYAEFEGMRCPVPGNCHAYLSSLYGDYMQVPPEYRRERHFVYQFKCDLPE